MCSSLLIHVDFTYCLKTLVLKTQCLAKPWHVHHFEKLGFKVGPLLLGVYVCFQLRSKMAVLDARLKTSIFFIRVENIQFQPKKKGGTNCETKLHEVRHMSSPKFHYLGLPNSVSKTNNAKRVWPPLHSTSLPPYRVLEVPMIDHLRYFAPDLEKYKALQFFPV